eukprot:s552_g1.t1
MGRNGRSRMPIRRFVCGYELHEWKLGIYRLKVQTPGVEEELKSLDDLWKCEFFPCYVEWVKGTSRYSRYLVLDQQKTASAKERATIWRLADCSENHIKGHMLTAKQKSQEFEILHEDFLKAGPPEVSPESLGKSHFLLSFQAYRRDQL